MTHRYPWRVEPGPNESLPSMLERLSAATGHPVSELFPHSLATLTDGPDHDRLRLAASVLGHKLYDVRQRTLRARLGGRFEALKRSELRHPAGLGCPGCGTAPIWSRLVLVTTCTRCGLLLTGDTTPVTAPPAAIELQQAYLTNLRHPRPNLDERFRRWWRLLDLHTCLSCSAIASSTDTLPSHRTSPSWVAAVAEQCWASTASGRATRRAIGDVVLDRLRPPQGGHAIDAERDQLHEILRRSGLRSEQIPTYVRAEVKLLDAGCHGEEAGSAIARALSREALHARDGGRPSITVIDQLHGDTDDRPIATALTQAFGNTTSGLRILQREATALAAQPRSDYQARRAALRSLRSVPATVLAHGGLAHDHQTSRLAAAWIWIELTRGILRAGPHRASLRSALRTFDARLRPETRLALLEHGQALLDAVANDAAWDAAITRRPLTSATTGQADVG